MLTRQSLVACVALMGVGGAVLVGHGGLGTVVGCGIAEDARPSGTAKDWVTQADHVVVATPEREQETNRRDFTTGAVHYVTDRTVTFRTDRVLWSASGQKRTVSKGFDMVAAGWSVYRESGRRVKRTTAEAPRLEPGHTYLLAVRWEEATAGGRGGWTVLGEGAAVPFDDHTVGQGEWCGRTLTKEDVAEAERFARSGDHSLEKTVLGRDEQAVTSELQRARARDK
ncbi:hypothetical protein [Streptomyces sp. NPDC002328]|uniref:hypothetical protein n=1 Tax=Streptomyces sp. NPDC002328 TaxID=3364642 RepID=UPI0036D17A74